MEWTEFLLFTKHPVERFVEEYGWKIEEFTTLNPKGIYKISIYSDIDVLREIIHEFISEFKLFEIVLPSIDEILDEINETNEISFRDIVLLNKQGQ